MRAAAGPSPYGADAARRAADLLRTRLGDAAPVMGLVLGSGLGAIVRRFERALVIPFAEIPGFPNATVAGHQGALVSGTLERVPVLALAGRFHLYEGHDAALAGYPVRLLHALGARTLFVSNAAGAIRRSFRPGDLMLIRDHLNLTGRNPLVGALEPGDERFPDMSQPYDPVLGSLLRDAALEERIVMQEGVYAALLGPAYETPAEVRMLTSIGADAVGMSTVPEVIVARAIGMRVAGVSCMTNMACGIASAPITHADVLETTARVGASFERLVCRLVSRVAALSP